MRGFGTGRLPIEDKTGTWGVTKSRPVLRRVENPRDFNGVLFNLIHRDIGQRGEGQFAPPVHAPTLSPQVGKIPQMAATVVDGLGYARGSFRVVTFDALANALEVFCGLARTNGFPSRL